MCELLGMNFDAPVTSTFTFRGFTKRGKDNPDGWGIALYPTGKNKVLLIKETLNANQSELAKHIWKSSNFLSDIYIAHVRKASVGIVSDENTHPFVQECLGKTYCFAHNGTLKGAFRRELALGRFQPKGGTDSEHAFCHLLAFMESETTDWCEQSFVRLHDKLNHINTYGHFNCLFSDGEYLFGYHDKNGYNGLHYVKRASPFQTVKLMDDDYVIDLQQHKLSEKKGYIIATRPLTNEDWHAFSPGRLMVFKSGELVFGHVI